MPALPSSGAESNDFRMRMVEKLNIHFAAIESAESAMPMRAALLELHGYLLTNPEHRPFNDASLDDQSVHFLSQFKGVINRKLDYSSVAALGTGQDDATKMKTFKEEVSKWKRVLATYKITPSPLSSSFASQPAAPTTNR